VDKWADLSGLIDLNKDVVVTFAIDT